MAFKAIITEFCSDALTDFHSEPILYSYFNFIVCSVSDFISVIAFVSGHVYFNRDFIEIIM